MTQREEMDYLREENRNLKIKLKRAEAALNKISKAVIDYGDNEE